MQLLRSRRFRVTILLILGILGVGAEILYLQGRFVEVENMPTPAGEILVSPGSTDYSVLPEPVYTTSAVVTGLSNPWDMAFVDPKTFLYTQRGGQVRGHNLETAADWLVAAPSDVNVRGEGGLLGLIVDVNFTDNKYFYTCMNVVGPSISVVRWQLSDDLQMIVAREDIITGIPANPSGRHSGCRLVMGADGHLWVGTGDTAVGTLPQDPNSLGGKVLRVDRHGVGVAGNMAAPFDARIFSYGHRNTQGITLFPVPIGDVYGFTSQHGTGESDEVNLLKVGNFGWDPVPGYNETVLMTDLVKFPDAISAIWDSGLPTIAVSGMTIVDGAEWGAWNGAVLLAVQKDMHVRLLRFDRDFQLVQERALFDQFDRIRTVVQGPDGSLYLLTDNGGGQDQIVQVVAE
jgi:aldose sugar dehydrogenase